MKIVSVLNPPTDLQGFSNVNAVYSLQELAPSERVVGGVKIETAPTPTTTDNNADLIAVEKTANPDEIFETEDSGDKILGMSKNLAIGLGVAIVAIGGFFVYKKFIAKS